ncbi:MAG: hypothetical protein GC158_07160 [Cyanobacteria bacterium RI_101]|nr:hypothetical protein [Cyanobacteria bacterium RI_101]
MDPITAALLMILGIYSSGIVNKAGEDTWDVGRQLLRRKLANTPTGKALAAGQEPNPDQALIDVEAISADPELEELKSQLQTLLAQNEEFKRQAEAIKKNIQINRDQAQGYLFEGEVKSQFLGGTHIHHHGAERPKTD